MKKANAKGWAVVLSLFTIILMVSGSSANEQISSIIPIGAYYINQTTSGQEVSIENFGQLLVPGKPNLPSKIFSIAIPPGAKVDEVTFDVGEGTMLEGTYQIPPSPLPRVIGQENPLIYEQDKQRYQENYNSIYGKDEPYPASAGEFIGPAGFRKYNLVDVRITPFSYRPKSGQLTFYPQITVNIKYTISQALLTETIADNLPRQEKIAQEIILNYDQARSWYPNSIGGKETYDFVIITLPALETSVAPLVEWETLKGRSVNVVTTTWINANYTGYDLAEKMRNFLRDKYPSTQWGIEDVLLVGDYDDVPMRRCWQDVGYGKPETDFYYAELSLPDNQSWDSDKDHQWGENSDPIDFYAEVNVGRIPWSVPATVLHICEKSAAYEANGDPAYKKHMLLLGAFFWEDTDNAVLMEAKIDQLSGWTFTRMYEQGYSTYDSDYNLRYTNVRSVWSSGQYAFVNWAGHGSEIASYIMYSTGEAFVSTSICPFLNDNYPAIVFADACSNSDTDHGSNIGKKMLERGAVGFLGATKVAYGSGGWDNPSDGSSQSLDYYFTTQVTSLSYTQGEAHQWALRYMYTHGLWYMVKYEMFEWGALWGNPDLGMATVITNYPPVTPAQPSGIVEGLPGVEYQFSCSTTDPDGDNLYYMFDWGDDTDDGWLGPFASGETCTGSHIWNSSSQYQIRVKARDTQDNESDWSGPLSVDIYTCGDCNKDGTLGVDDVVYLLNYLYKGGSTPDPLQTGDVNGDGAVDLGDVVYLINYLYRSGPAPSC